MNDRVVKSFAIRIRIHLRRAGSQLFCSGSIVFALLYRKDPAMKSARRYLPPALATFCSHSSSLAFLPPVYAGHVHGTQKRDRGGELSARHSRVSGTLMGQATDIQGFTTDISVNAGQPYSQDLHRAVSYRIDIYRLGFYQGNDGRLVTSISPSMSLPQIQPPCLTGQLYWTNRLRELGHIPSWTVPSTAMSGIYFAKLLRLIPARLVP